MAEVEVNDVVLIAGDQRFPCNRQMLIKYSRYFMAMFNSDMIESRSEEIHLQGTNPDALKALIDYTHNCKFQANRDNVFSVLEAASMFQFDAVRDACIGFLKAMLDVSNCLYIMQTADSFGIMDLYRQALQLAFWEFQTISERSEVLELSVDALTAYLSNCGLRITSELDIFKCIIRWVEFDITNRLTYLPDLLQTIRFSCLLGKEMQSINQNYLVKANERSQDIVNALIKLHKLTYKQQWTEPKSEDSSSINSEHSQSENDDQTFRHQDSKSESANNNINSTTKPILSDLTHCCNGKTHCLPTSATENKNADGFSNSKRAKITGVVQTCCYCCSSSCGSTQSSPTEDENGLNAIAVSALQDANEPVINKELCLLAQQLLAVKSRKIPLVPVVVGQIFCELGEKNTEPDLAYFDDSTKELKLLLKVTKVFRKTNMAMGYKVCALGKDIYILGGEFLLGYSNWNTALWRYDTFKEAWFFEVNLRQPRRHHSVCVLGSKIYLIGGLGKHRIVLSSVDSYNTVSGEWEAVKALPQATYAVACTAFNNKIYVLETHVYCYDPVTDCWTQMRNVELPNHSGFHSALPHRNGIYLVGRYSQDLLLFNPDGFENENKKMYSVVGQFSFASNNACIIDDKIYIFSAEDYCMIEVYDIQNDEFKVEFTGKCQSPINCHGCFSLPLYLPLSL